MPFYDYKCNTCNAVHEIPILYSKRNQPQECLSCGKEAVYQFPTSGIFGFQPFESYYDESLNMDIHGRRHKEQTMKALNVIEAGDKVHGGRNYDSSAPETIKPISKLSGRSLDDIRREDEKREEDTHNFVVGTENKDGKTVDNYKRAADLPSPKNPPQGD
tara:strand:- start:397 stop:876 length:480 start_codon:yes stop_codon:yes gene_type:complete